MKVVDEMTFTIKGVRLVYFTKWQTFPLEVKFGAFIFEINLHGDMY